MVWSWKLTDRQRGGVTSRQFLRAHVLRLGVGDEVTHILRGGVKRSLAVLGANVARFPQERS